MNEWTDTARSVLEQHLNRHRARFTASGAEADEVIGDLRRHIESEAAAAGLAVVTETDVRRILAKLDPELLAEPVAVAPESPAPNPSPVAPAPATAPAKRPLSAFARGLLWLFGVLLPAFTLGFELYTDACAGEVFDPTPTWLHTLLIALVPLANAAALLRLRKTETAVPVWLWWAQAVAVGVTGAYALAFLPLTPVALVGVVFLVGFLPLAPLLGWISVLVLGSALRQQAARTGAMPPRFRWVGWVAALGLLAAPSVPGVLTRHWLDQAVWESPEEATRAIQSLRRFGSEEALLRACYGQTRDAWADLLNLRYLPAEQVQTVFFRVTGQPYNAVRPPLSRLRGPGARMLGDFEWDNAVGGEAVAGHVSGLSLNGSRLDAMGNANDGWGYTEWTLEFRNDHDFQAREARAEIQLPPGGVVSRVTLWVNGEEREAAFAGRGEVRAAYQQVAVVKRRDPILVTTSGPDRVLMQCFPVPSRGGLMKVRLGITAPLNPVAPGEVAFVWPRFAERNFAIRADLRHHAWLEAQQPVVTQPAGWTPDAGRSNALHAAVSERAGADAFPIIRLKRTVTGDTGAWVRDERAATNAWVRQQLTAETRPTGGRLAIVLDGGRGGRAWADALRAALEQAGGRAEVGVWLAHDGVIEAFRGEGPVPFTEAGAGFAAKLPPFAGGHDPTPALDAAWNWAGQRRDGTVLWIHGPQPVLAGDFLAIRQRLERTLAGGTRLLDFQAGLGPNLPAKELADLAAYATVPRLGPLTADLVRVLREATGAAPRPHWTRERVPAEPVGALTASRHVVRLWAADEIERLRRAKRTAAAVKLAGDWHLVTPVSGAVVLENRQQFDEAGLTAVDPLTTPSVVPEPATWALLGVGTVVLLWLGRGRSQRPRGKTR
jgi:hypothetical protein